MTTKSELARSVADRLAHHFLEATVEKRGTDEEKVYKVLAKAQGLHLGPEFEQAISDRLPADKREELMREVGTFNQKASPASRLLAGILRSELDPEELRLADSLYSTGATNKREEAAAEGVSMARFLARLGIGVGSGVGGTMAGAAVGTMICPVIGTVIGALIGGVLGGGGGEIAAQKLVDGEQNIRWGAVAASGLLGGLGGGAGALTTVVKTGAMQLGEGALIQGTFKTAQVISASDKTGIVGFGQRAAVNGGQSIVATGIEAAAGERSFAELADPLNLAASVFLGEASFRGAVKASTWLPDPRKIPQRPHPETDLEPYRGITHQRSRNGHPLMSAEDYQRLYETDTRALGETKTATFDFQGYIHEDRPGFEMSGKTPYVDVMATNGILKGKDHPGVHIGTDGVVSYSSLTKNHEMTSPRDVGEYDIYITIPGKLQREKKVVVNYDDCYSPGDYRERFGASRGEIKDLQKREKGWVVIRLMVDPKSDPLARQKVQIIHNSLVRFIENGGPLYRIRDFVYQLENELMDLDAAALARKRLQ